MDIDLIHLIPAVYEKVISDYNVDTSRVYLFGHSAGGNIATRAAQLYPELFAAAAIHNGDYDLEKRAPKYREAIS